MKKLSKIEIKLTILTLLFALIIAFGLASIVLPRADAIILKGGYTALYNISYAQKTSFENLILSEEKRVSDFSSDGYIRDFVSNYKKGTDLTAITEHLIKNKQSLGSNIVGINLYDLKGNTIASTSKSEIGLNVLGEKLFDTIIRGPYAQTSIEFIEDTNHFKVNFQFENSLIVISTPLKDRVKREDIGVLALFFDSSEVDKLFQRLNSRNKANPSATQTYIVDSMLSVIYGEIKYKNLAYPTFSACSDNDGNLGIYTNYQNVKVIGVAQCLFNNSILLVSEIPESELISYTQNARITFPILLTICVGLITLASYLVYSNLISKRLDILQKGINQLELNNFDIHLKTNSNDELDKLIQGFNIMARKLRAYYSSFESELKAKTTKLTSTLEDFEKQNEILNQSRSAFYNIFEDIETEKKEAERLAQELKKYELAVKNTSSHIVFTDPKGVILFANDGVTNITGYSKEEVIGKTPALWGKQMPPDFYKNFWHLISVEKKPFTGEIVNKRKNGELYTAKSIVNPILDKDGNVMFFVGLEEDISKDKEVDKMKTEFVSLASHQLKTPLSAINWYAEMLLDGDGGKLSEDQSMYLKEIFASNQRMIKLVNSLLNVSRIDMGTFLINPEPTDLKEIANIVIKELQPKIKEKNLNVMTEFKIEGMYNLDQDLTKIILQNLISNSVKYTPANGAIKVQIDTDVTDINIIVADNGYGITQSQQNKIFQKLFRADNIKSKESDGTGLGLYLVKSILDESGGKIDFKSIENQGSVFIVKIPLSGMIKKDGSKKLEVKI